MCLRVVLGQALAQLLEAPESHGEWAALGAQVAHMTGPGWEMAQQLLEREQFEAEQDLRDGDEDCYEDEGDDNAE